MLEIIRRAGPIGAPAILRELGEPITLRVLQKDLKHLRQAGWIIAIGRGKAITYRVKEEDG